MRGQHTSASVGRPTQKETPHDRAMKFAAVQVRLKEEAAARRAVAPQASGSRRVARAHHRPG